jgi:hypothetical protein
MDRRITIKTIASLLDALSDEDLSDMFWRIEEILRTKKVRRKRSFIGIHKPTATPRQ